MCGVCGMMGEDAHFIWYDEISPMNWAAWAKFIKEKNMNETNVENLIQASKDQNGRVYRTLQEQEKRIKGLENELNDAKTWYGTHVCPIVKHTALDDSVPNTQLFNRLHCRIGTKGILKMLAER